MPLKVLEICKLEGAQVCCLENDWRGEVGIEGFLPSGGTEAPAIAWFESGKVKLGTRGGEVIACILGEGEEFRGHYRANGMNAAVIWSQAAVTIAHESGEWVHAAGLKRAAEDVALFGHGHDVVEVLTVGKEEELELRAARS